MLLYKQIVIMRIFNKILWLENSSREKKDLTTKNSKMRLKAYLCYKRVSLKSRSDDHKFCFN